MLHGNQLEALQSLLIEVVTLYPLPALSAEIILVQNNGMKHWLEMSLAKTSALGICAATRIELPSTYLWRIYRAVLCGENIPVQTPFDKHSLTWRLYRLLPTLIGRAEFEPLQRYLSDPKDARRLYQLCNQVADVFDGYQNYRASWLNDWANQSDVLDQDPYLNPLYRKNKALILGKDELWQAQLWREIIEDMGIEMSHMSRASVHERFMQRMDELLVEFARTGQRPKDLPQRVIIFGLSSMSPQMIEAFSKLGQMCQVFMFVQNPCKNYWGNLIDGHVVLKNMQRTRQSVKPGDLHINTNPLLASWGKQGRDYLHLLDDFDNVEQYADRLTKVDVFIDPLENAEGPSQLKHIQSSILNLEPIPTRDNRLTKPASDTSVVFVRAHSAQREVEILHDQMLSWFDYYESIGAPLAYKDVMIMVPDIDTFAPHIKAVFGRFKPTHDRFIPFSISDTTPKEVPVVRALTQLLSTARSKISVLDWIDLFEVDAVSHRFDLTGEDLLRLRALISASGVRWGLDKEHRAAHHLDKSLPGIEQNTWAFGVRRILLGYALEENQSWCETLALPGVRGLDTELVSKLLLWLDAVERLNAVLGRDHTASEWVVIFNDMIQDFFLPCDDAQELLLGKITEPLDEWERICTESRLNEQLPQQVVSEYWLSRLEDIGLQKRFFGGGVQFGTLLPMRSIPFKIIGLLGMNDGDFPRRSSAKDFDLMVKYPKTGDRSRREDDRFLFLEAVLCAREKLYISWQGFSAKDNTVKPPSVLIAQLLDYLKACWVNNAEPVVHPLQPFSEKYFSNDPELFTYDKEWEATRFSFNKPSDQKTPAQSDFRAQQIKGEEFAQKRSINESQITGVIASKVPNPLQIDELYRLMRHPVEVFFRSRLSITFERPAGDASHSEPFALNALELYELENNILTSEDLEQGFKNLALSGRLPISGMAQKYTTQMREKLLAIHKRREHWESQYPRVQAPLNVQVAVGEFSISANFQELRCTSETKAGLQEYLLREFRVGRVIDKFTEKFKFPVGHAVTKLWTMHLVACAQGLRVSSVLIAVDAEVVFKPLAPELAHEILLKLLSVYKIAWERPLPAACKSAWMYVQGELYADFAKQINAAKDKPPSNSAEKSNGKAKTSSPKALKISDPHDLARAKFEPAVMHAGVTVNGERLDSPYLIRAFAGYDDLKDELPTFAHSLYLDMAKAATLCDLGVLVQEKS